MRERQQQVDTISSKLTDLKLKIGRINTAFTDGSIDLTEFKPDDRPKDDFGTKLGQSQERRDESD